MKTSWLAALAAMALAGNTACGFTLNFVNNIGDTVPPSLTINVPGYGDVQIDALVGNLVVATNFTSGGVPIPTLEFDPGEMISVTFLGAAPENLMFDFLNVSPGESTTVNGSGLVFTAQVNGVVGVSNGAGLREITFTAVPECSAVLMGLLGGAGVVLRRRR